MHVSGEMDKIVPTKLSWLRFGEKKIAKKSSLKCAHMPLFGISVKVDMLVDKFNIFIHYCKSVAFKLEEFSLGGNRTAKNDQSIYYADMET